MLFNLKYVLPGKKIFKNWCSQEIGMLQKKVYNFNSAALKGVKFKRKTNDVGTGTV